MEPREETRTRRQLEEEFDGMSLDRIISCSDRDSHGLESFIPDWDPESETKEEYEERKQKEADAVLPYI